MAKANNNKPRVKVKFLNLLLVLLGADLILLFAPFNGWIGWISFLVSDEVSWAALIVGIVLIALGFRGLYEKVS